MHSNAAAPKTQQTRTMHATRTPAPTAGRTLSRRLRDVLIQTSGGTSRVNPINGYRPLPISVLRSDDIDNLQQPFRRSSIGGSALPVMRAARRSAIIRLSMPIDPNPINATWNGHPNASFDGHPPSVPSPLLWSIRSFNPVLIPNRASAAGLQSQRVFVPKCEVDPEHRSGSPTRSGAAAVGIRCSLTRALPKGNLRSFHQEVHDDS